MQSDTTVVQYTNAKYTAVVYYYYNIVGITRGESNLLLES